MSEARAENLAEYDRSGTDNIDLFGGLAGVELEPDSFDFGNGMKLRRTYVSLTSLFMMKFQPEPPGGDDSGPRRWVSGGYILYVSAELHVPIGFNSPSGHDRLNVIWWVTTLIRLRACSAARLPLVSESPFIRVAAFDRTPKVFAMEVYPWSVEENPEKRLDSVDLEWVRDRLGPGGRLTRANTDLYFAVLAFNRSLEVGSAPLGTVEVWGALERLFSPTHAELTFRVSANIAAFLEVPGVGRLALFKRVAKLYGARSKAAHGAGDESVDAFRESWALLRRVLVRILDDDRVPSRDDLERALFGV